MQYLQERNLAQMYNHNLDQSLWVLKRKIQSDMPVVM